MKVLLQFLHLLDSNGKTVSSEANEAAKSAGAKDVEIHDNVLIAAAFCMFIRYVDGLGTAAPLGSQFYISRAPQRAEFGYLMLR